MAEYGVQTYDNLNKVIDIDLNTGSDATSDGDLLSEPQLLNEASHVGGVTKLQSLRLVNRDDQESDVDIIFLRSNTTLGTDNAALVTSDADLLEVATVVHFDSDDYYDLGSGKVAVKSAGYDEGMGFLISPSDSDDLYVASVARDTDAYSSNGINLQIGFERM